MFGFGKKKKQENIVEKDVAAEKVPSGMRETAERMMSGQFDMNDMLAQLKQIKKMSNFSGLLKMVPGMSGAVAAMKEKINADITNLISLPNGILVTLTRLYPSSSNSSCSIISKPSGLSSIV